MSILQCKSVNFEVEKCQFSKSKLTLFQVAGRFGNADSRFGYGNIRFARCSSLASMDFVRIGRKVRSVYGEISIGEVFHVGKRGEKGDAEMLKVQFSAIFPSLGRNG